MGFYKFLHSKYYMRPKLNLSTYRNIFSQIQKNGYEYIQTIDISDNYSYN